MHDRMPLVSRDSQIRDSHEAEQTLGSRSLNVSTIPRTGLTLPSIPRYEETSYSVPGSPVDDASISLFPLSPDEAASPPARTAPEPDSPKEHSVTYSIPSPGEGLETCPLDVPGCYVLVPAALNPTENTRTADQDAKNYRDKKAFTTKKGSRKPIDESERQAIKLNRKLGVCLRCKLFKEKCRGGIPCDRCRSLKLWKNICVQAQFTEKAVFNRRIYQDRMEYLLDNIRDWDPQDSCISNPEYFEAHNGYPPTLTLKASKFTPHDVKLLEHIVWRVAGKPDYRPLPSTCFGLKEELSADDLDLYLDKHLPYILQEESQAVDEESGIHASTIRAAYDYSNGNKNLSSLVGKSLRIYVAQTFFFRSVWRIGGPNTLGMKPIGDSTSKSQEMIPLPRLVNQQLDAYIENRIATLEKELLAELQSHILDRNAYDWFGIFLTIYVQLSSLEKDIWSLETWEHDFDMLHERVRALDLQNPQWGAQNKSFVWPLKTSPSECISKNVHLANMLVSHFRTVSKGYIPFNLNWDSKQVVQMAGEEKEAVDYMKKTSQQIPKLESEHYLRARQAAQYSRTDCNSLEGKFTTRLMLSDET